MGEEHVRPLRDSQAGTERIHGFALYFKRYMGVSAVFAAAAPVPVAVLRLIPTYSAQVGFLGVYTSLFDFLVLAFVFYSRHWIAHVMFRRGDLGVYRTRPVAAWLPLILICSSLGSMFLYHAQVSASIQDRQIYLVSGHIQDRPSEIMRNTEASDIPRATVLIVLYLGIFLLAEAAFAVMALREYLQDLLGISEGDLLARVRLAE
jgi:hypothetical protein